MDETLHAVIGREIHEAAIATREEAYRLIERARQVEQAWADSDVAWLAGGGYISSRRAADLMREGIAQGASFPCESCGHPAHHMKGDVPVCERCMRR